MIDECLTFMIAATQTTTLLVTNASFYLTQNKEKVDKLREEIKRCTKEISDVTHFGKLNDVDWAELLLQKELMNNCNYLSHVVAETLRIDPSVRFSSLFEFTENTEIKGKKVIKGQKFGVDMYAL